MGGSISIVFLDICVCKMEEGSTNNTWITLMYEKKIMKQLNSL